MTKLFTDVMHLRKIISKVFFKPHLMLALSPKLLSQPESFYSFKGTVMQII